MILHFSQLFTGRTEVIQSNKIPRSELPAADNAEIRTEDTQEESKDMPVFVMTEEGEMLISSDQIEKLPELKKQIAEAEASTPGINSLNTYIA
jgi:hypothetical protein